MVTTDTLTPVVQVPGQLDLPEMPATPEPAATKPATTTKLTGLTNSNTTALTGLEGWTVTKTTATYTGTPVKALACGPDPDEHRPGSRRRQSIRLPITHCRTQQTQRTAPPAAATPPSP